MVNRLIIGYLVVVSGLFLYSFTQVDLNLTLSQWSIWQVLEKFFQHIGYFQRPLSTLLYTFIILLLFAFYILFLRLSNANRIKKNQIWFLILATTAILTFSYNAFSYDLFNYIFDAKIVTYYHQNPYIHKALDYPLDPMLSFMRWTHRVYPYGPFWLLATVPLSFIGFNFFLPTFFLFKILASLSFVGTVFFVGKILRKVFPQHETFGLVFLGLNPLVIIESLVSAHNDIIMMFLLILSIFLFMNKNYVRSLLMFLFSIGTKFATFFALPVFVFMYFLQKSKKNIPWLKVFLSLLVFMAISIVLASFRTNFQPWYLINVLPIAALAAKKYFVLIPSLVISFFSLLQYVPFLYTGNWDKPIPTILFWLTVSSILCSIVICLWYGLFRKTQS